MMAHPVSRALDAARRLTARTWVVFPADRPDASLHCLGSPRACRERRCGAESDPSKRGKHPAVITQWGELAAPADEASLAEWFTDERYNVALAAGPSGLLIVDDDAAGGFERYAASIGEVVPATFRVRTRQGWHHYFTVPVDPETGERARVGNEAGLLASWGCDVRGGAGPSGGRGGYVIGPGSQHWTNDPDAYTVPDWSAGAIEAPGWLIEAVTPPGPPRQQEGGAGAAAATGTGHGPGSRWDDDTCFGTEQDLVDRFTRHCAEVDTPGAAFRHSLFRAARDGWRLVNLDPPLLTVDELYRELEVCVRRVWDAEPDDRDDKIVNVEAFQAAQRSPWGVRPDVVTERVPVDPDRFGGFIRPGDEPLPRSSSGAVTSDDATEGTTESRTTDGNRTVDAGGIPSVDTGT